MRVQAVDQTAPYKPVALALGIEGALPRAFWDSSVSASHEGSFIPVLTAGVSYLKAQIADALDEQLLCQRGWGSTTLSHEAIY